MHIGMIGLGRMGGNMARRLARANISVCGFSHDAARARGDLADETKVQVVGTFEDLIRQLKAPRLVWLMVPAGEPTEQNIQKLAAALSPGDVVVDGGNTHYKDSQRRAALLAAKGIGFVDVGVSGGIWGLENGYGLMFGGAREHVDVIQPLVRALAPAPDKGWVYCGPAGAGHFAKMVHNGIEYGLMQAYAEGFSVLAAKQEFELPLAQIAEAWRHGTVIRSWLLDLTADALSDNDTLIDTAPRVADSGEGRWTAHEAIDLGVPTPAINAALTARFNSQGQADFAARLLALLRNRFGGHEVRRD